MRDERRALGAALLGAALAAAAAPGPAGAQDDAAPIPPPVIPAATLGADAAPPPPMPAGKFSVMQPSPVPPAAPIHVYEPGAIAPGAHAGPHGHHVHQPGPIGRAVHHIGYTIKDRMVGEHERFNEPPLGWSYGQNFGAQRAMADVHRFTLYRTDFLAGSERLTPEGLRRLGRMMARWDLYGGPLLVEDDPRRPGLAEARRLAVLELAASNGAVLDPGRLVVGGSPYLGGRGDLSEIYDGVLLDRSLRAPTTYPVPPLPNADFQN